MENGAVYHGEINFGREGRLASLFVKSAIQVKAPRPEIEMEPKSLVCALNTGHTNNLRYPFNCFSFSIGKGQLRAMRTSAALATVSPKARECGSHLRGP